MKRTLLLTIGMMLFAALVLGASGGGPKGTAGAPMEISWLGLGGGDIQDGNATQKYIEEKFNVKLINKQMAYSEPEPLNLMVSSGEHPEAMYNWINTVDWYMKGAFRSIPKSMIEKYAPLYTKNFNSLGPGAWYYGLVPGKKDEYIGMVRHEDYQNGCGYLPIFRLDYLEKANIKLTPKELNASKIEDLVPENPGHFFLWYDRYKWDQIEKIMAAFRDGDLDGNGKNDTIAYGGRGRLIYWGGLGLVFYTYGVNEVDNYNENGKTVKDATYSRSKEALKVLQRWFREKLLDSELPAVDNNQARGKITEGIIASWMRTNTCGIQARWGASDFCEDTIAVNPNAKTVVTLMPLSPYGDTRCRFENKAMPLTDTGCFVVKSGVSDEKLAKILEIYDYLNFDKEGMVIGWFGLPDQHFDWSGEPWNSPAIAKEGVKWGGTSGIFGYNAYTPHEALLKFTTRPEYVKYQDYFVFGEGKKDALPAYREDIFRQTKYTELWSQYSAALNSIRDEFFWKAITTNMDIEAEWPKYVQTWMNAGGTEVLAEISKAPTVADIRAGKVTPPSN